MPTRLSLGRILFSASSPPGGCWQSVPWPFSCPRQTSACAARVPDEEPERPTSRCVTPPAKSSFPRKAAFPGSRGENTDLCWGPTVQPGTPVLSLPAAEQRPRRAP